MVFIAQSWYQRGQSTFPPMISSLFLHNLLKRQSAASCPDEWAVDHVIVPPPPVRENWIRVGRNILIRFFFLEIGLRFQSLSDNQRKKMRNRSGSRRRQKEEAELKDCVVPERQRLQFLTFQFFMPIFSKLDFTLFLGFGSYFFSLPIMPLLLI